MDKNLYIENEKQERKILKFLENNTGFRWHDCKINKPNKLPTEIIPSKLDSNIFPYVLIIDYKDFDLTIGVHDTYDYNCIKVKKFIKNNKKEM